MPHKRTFLSFSLALFLAASPALVTSYSFAANLCDREALYEQWYDLTQAPEGSDDSLISALENYSNKIMYGITAVYGGEIPDGKYCEVMDKAISTYTSDGCYIGCAGFWEMCYTAQGTQPRAEKNSTAWQNCEISKKKCVVRNCAKAN